MKVILYTLDNCLLAEWKEKIATHEIMSATSHNDLLQKMHRNFYDVLCIDISSFGNPIKDFIQDILVIHPETKILILSKEPSFSEGKDYLWLYAKGYGNAHMLEIHFNDALETIKKGDIWLYPEFIQNMIQIITRDIPSSKCLGVFEKLTSKERDIADLVYKGFTNQEIADNLGITLRTVKAHISAIFEKTGAKDRINLVLMFQKNG
ncbi:MAG: response regulator transcription factor [Campylobacter sp.]